MGDYLMRDAAPLSEQEWEQLDQVIVKTARQFLVGRRFLDLAGPYGAGLEVVPVGTGAARRHIPLTVISERFRLHWRDIEASRQMGLGLELGPAAQAALACAQQEDSLILQSLMEAADKQVKLGDWSVPDVPLADVVAATETLFTDGFVGPYALVLSPVLHGQTLRVSRGMGRTVEHLIKEVVDGGIYRTQLLSGLQGLVLALGAHNFDLVIGQDLIAAYEGNEGLDHTFCVLETLALRVKRPGAVCKLVG